MLRVQRVGPIAIAGIGRRGIEGGGLLTVLEIAPANPVHFVTDGGPDGGGRALRGGFEMGGVAAVLVDPAEGTQIVGRQMLWPRPARGF